MDLREELSKLSLSELTSILLPVYEEKIKNLSPQQLLARYETNKFTSPAEISPEILNRISNDMFNIAKRSGAEPILLSPVEPLGTCAVVGPVSQHKILSSLRGTEVAADPTNMLALETALRIKKKTHKHPVDLCAVQRIVRTQPFEGDFRSHFSPFCRTTSSLDTGSYAFEKHAIYQHIRMYKDILHEILHAGIKVNIQARKGYKHTHNLITSVRDHLTDKLPDVYFTADHSESANNYYKGMQFYIIAVKDGNDIPVGEGGLTDWTQQLTGNKKERFLISGIGLDLLVKRGIIYEYESVVKGGK